MSYKIVVDSCCDLPDSYKNDERFQRIPLGLEVGEYQILDDDNFNQKEFLARVAAYPKSPKSSCPSPQAYADAYVTDAERVYVVTLSSHLSGSHNSAVLGRSLYWENHGKKDICVIDSESASPGEVQIALKLIDLEESGFSFAQIVAKIEKFRDQMKTYFVLDNLETLRKNGRLTGVKALVASTLSIKPVMGSLKGQIIQRGQSIGIKKALRKMADLVVAELTDSTHKRLIITHCNAYQRAEIVRDMILEKCAFLEALIMDTAGLSSMYANDGGVIVAV
jgi:DegV family protein with EDD domain